MNKIAVVDYGAGNTRSVRAAFAHIGSSSEVTNDPIVIRNAEFVVLPGVGSAKSAMEHLIITGAAKAIRQRYDEGAPTMGICLGMQLAFDSTDEDGGVVGLGLLPGRVRRLRVGRVPRLGWAVVDPWDEAFYFAHSYVCESSDTVATSDGLTVAARRGSFFGVQFHPEKSGAAGLRFLEQCLSPA